MNENDGWPEKFAKASVRRGRPPKARPKVSTTIGCLRRVGNCKPEGRWALQWLETRGHPGCQLRLTSCEP